MTIILGNTQTDLFPLLFSPSNQRIIHTAENCTYTLSTKRGACTTYRGGGRTTLRLGLRVRLAGEEDRDLRRISRLSRRSRSRSRSPRPRSLSSLKRDSLPKLDLPSPDRIIPGGRRTCEQVT